MGERYTVSFTAELKIHMKKRSENIWNTREYQVYRIHRVIGLHIMGLYLNEDAKYAVQDSQRI